MTESMVSVRIPATYIYLVKNNYAYQIYLDIVIHFNQVAFSFLAISVSKSYLIRLLNNLTIYRSIGYIFVISNGSLAGPFSTSP